MILQIKKRKRKAYSTAFIVSVSYLSLQVIKPLLSNERYQIKLARRHQRNAARVMGTIVELNGLFIKVGQLLSILSNILPESYRTALETLQDKAPASSCERIEETILSELNQSCYTIFDDFSREPIASASIGQVHIAYLKTGQKVAVKVQHSHIEKLADLDLKIVESLVKMTGKIFKINGLENIYSQIRIMIEEELDYSYEAIAMASVKLSLKKYDKIIVPEVFNEFSSTKVLVTAFCEGKKVTNPDLYESGQVSANAVCENLMEAYCKMFLVDGYYHADPHPGNILVNELGEIILLDFGAVGTLSDKTRKEIPKFLQAIVANDTDKVLSSMQKMGFVGKDKDTEKTAQKMIEAMNDFINSGVNFSDLDYDTIKNSNIDQLRKELGFKELTSTFDVPKDWILLQRSLVLLLGIYASISPDYNPVKTIKPFIKKMVLSKEGFKNLVVDSLFSQATTLLGIPRKFDTFLTKANKGQIEIEIKGMERAHKKRNVLNWQFFIGACAFMSLVLAFVANHFQNSKYEQAFNTMSIVLGAIFLLQIIRFWFQKL